jgi:hypothetical protein
VSHSAHQTTSPDGRTWTITVAHERPSLKESRSEPFFWVSVAVTIVMVAVIVRLVMVDPTTPMMLAFVVPLALLWAVERASKLARPLVRAETDGPPRERVTWKADWFGRRRYLSRAVRAVAEGQFVSNPKGMRLVGHEAGASAQLRVEAKSTIKWT